MENTSDKIKENLNRFQEKGHNWDKKTRRTQIALAAAKAIQESVPLNNKMRVMDFGCGTGLVSIELADQVGKIDGYDQSETMLSQFNDKLESHKGLAQIELFQKDIFNSPPQCEYDVIYSNMTLHHIPDPKLLFNIFFQSLKSGGWIAISDLVAEDGTFHDDPEGVAHFGFDEAWLKKRVVQSGFSEVNWREIHHISKTKGEQTKDFPMFLLTAQKP